MQFLNRLTRQFTQTRPICSIAALAVTLLCCETASARTVYVNGAVAASGNGTTWATAYKYLRDALAVTGSNDDIWVAKGEYFPDDTDGVDKELIFGDREASFQLNGQKVYGGFNGTETDVNLRNSVTNPTILTGEIWTGLADYSSFHVVTVILDSTLDSFTVQKGWANGSFFWIRPRLPAFDQGGGCYVSLNKVLTLNSCTFSRNRALEFGGAIMIQNGSDTTSTGRILATNCVFDQNEANTQNLGRTYATTTGAGGAIFGNVTATGCTFTTNKVATGPTVSVISSKADGGAIFGNVNATNCIFTANTVNAIGDANSTNASGGAISGNVVGKNCTFTSNTSTAPRSFGGAIRGAINAANFVFITNTGAGGNTDDIDKGTGNGGGGALYTGEGDSALINCVFVKNTSGIRGGAIVAGPAANSIIVSDSTFLDNGVATGSKGAAITCMSIARVVNNIFWNTAASVTGFDQANFISVTGDGGLLRNTFENYPVPPDHAKNVMKLGAAAVFRFSGADSYLGIETETLITTDPLFVSTIDLDGADNIWRTADDGLRLRAASSAISTTSTIVNRGRLVQYRNFLLADTLDIDGDGNLTELIPADIAAFSRVQNTPSVATPFLDLGAYEFGDQLNAADISVEYPASTVLTDGAGIINLSALIAVPTTFVIKNVGASNLTNLSVSMDGVDASSFKFTQPLVTTVPLGGSTTFTVTFAPTAIGARNAVLRIASNDAEENPFDINLTGSGLLPDIAVDQGGADLVDATTNVSYGNVLLAATSVKTFTIRNNGLGNLGLQGLTLSGVNAASFTLTPPALSFLPPNATTTFGVSFAPSVVGNYNATIVIDNTDPDTESLFEIPLNGVGQGIPEIFVNQPFPNDAELVTGATNGFGTVKTTYTKTFNIRNTGTADITGLTVVVSGSKDYKLVAPKVSSLKPGEKTNFKITLKPSSAGTKTAVMRITSNDSSEGIIDINLTGKGVSSSRSKAGSRSAASFAKVDDSNVAGSVVTMTKAENGLKYLVLTIEKPANWAVSNQKIEVSSNLMDWFSGQKHTTVLSDTATQLKVRDNTPYTPEAKRYIRLK